MPLNFEDFARCKECHNADFVEEVVVTIPKILKKRENASHSLEAAERHVQYVCTACGAKYDI